METFGRTPQINTATINSVIVKVASLCNLNCKYCYVYNHEDKSYLSRPKYISEETFERIIDQIKVYCSYKQLHQFSIVFHGGEPTLLDIKIFQKFVQLAIVKLDTITVNFSIQTNATLLNEEWIKFFIEYNIRIGISLDGSEIINDSSRIFHSRKGSYNYTIKGVRLLQNFGIEPYILCVINPQYSGLDVYNHFLSAGIKSMDFLIPDTSHNSKPLLYGHYGDTPVSNYLLPIFDQWFTTDDSSISIRIFEDIIKGIFSGVMDTDSFGNPLMNYLVIETDGSIEILDSLRVCEENIGKSRLNISQSSFLDLYHDDSLVGKMLTSGIDLCKTCEECELKSICGGGYLPHRFSKENKFNNPSVWCADLKKLITHIQANVLQREPIEL